jgi:hypothetical protein
VIKKTPRLSVTRRQALAARTQGQAMVEFIIILPVLYMLIFGAIQIGLLYSAKISLNYAAFEAARMGALNNASYLGIRKGLIRGLGPQFTHSDDPAAVNTGFEAAEREVDNYVRIWRINPVQDDFLRFDATGHAIIPNDNLMFRSPLLNGGISIQDANLLKVRVEYCYRLVVPVINALLGMVNKARMTDDEVLPATSRSLYEDYEELCGDRASRNRGFVLSAEVIVRMQSPAYLACDKPMECVKTR